MLCSLVDAFKRDILSSAVEQSTELQKVITEFLEYSNS